MPKLEKKLHHSHVGVKRGDKSSLPSYLLDQSVAWYTTKHVQNEPSKFACERKHILGSFSIDDGNGSENVTFKINSYFSNTIAFIPIS